MHTLLTYQYGRGENLVSRRPVWRWRRAASVTSKVRDSGLYVTLCIIPSVIYELAETPVRDRYLTRIHTRFTQDSRRIRARFAADSQRIRSGFATDSQLIRADSR